MVFEKIKKHFEQKKEARQVFYVVEYLDKDNFYVVEERIAEIMLTNDWNFFELCNLNFAQKTEKPLTENKKPYYIYSLTDKGVWLYKHLDTKSFAPAYMQALYEKNQGTAAWHLRIEKKVIEQNFEEHNIKSMKGYTKQGIIKLHQIYADAQNNHSNSDTLSL